MKNRNLLWTLRFIFACCLALAGTVQAGQQAPWKKWAQNPPTIPFWVSFPTLKAESGTMVEVTLGDGIATTYGDVGGCYTATNASPLFANLHVRREYLLTVVATNLTELEMKFMVSPPAQMLTTKGSGAVPRTYSVWIDRELADTKAIYGQCDYYSNTFLVEIRDQQGAQWLLDDRSNDPGPAPGDGSFLEIGPARSLLTNRISIDWSVSLGRLYDGLAVGRLRLSESGLSRDVYTPKAIFYSAASTNARSQVELVAAQADKSLRQAKALQCFVDIIDPWTFAAADLTNLPALAQRLKTETNGVSLYLSNSISGETQAALTNYLGSGSSPEPLRTLLVREFNNLISGGSIFESNRFYGVSLSAETQFLLTSERSGPELLRLNRLLLQEAYPQQLAQRPYQTALNFYLPSQVAPSTNSEGVYTNLSGSPYVSWLIQNPQPLATTNLVVIESRNGVNRTNTLAFTPQSGTDNWALTTGVIPEKKVETRGIAFNYSGQTNRFETNIIRYAGSNAVYKCIEKYQVCPWGWELVESRVDPDGANLVTAFEFYEDDQNTATYGRPKLTRFPDGNWETRLYDEVLYEGMLLYVLRPFGGSPATPEAATISNCEAAHYEFWGNGLGGMTGTITHNVGDPDTGLLWTDYISNGFAGGNAEDFQGMVQAGGRNGSDHPVGLWITRATDSSGKGLAGHELDRQDAKGPEKVFYYHAGTLDEASGVFTLAHSVDQGPDWRQSIVNWGGSMPYFELDPYASATDSIGFLENQWVGVDLRKGRSTRDALIFKAGSLARKETTVYTGLDVDGIPTFGGLSCYRYRNDSLGHTTNITRLDTTISGREQVMFEASYRDANGKDGELLRWQVDESGARTEYAYDSLKRQVSACETGITNTLASIPAMTTSTAFDAFGRATAQSTTSGGQSLTNQSIYDLAGRVTREISTDGLVTDHSYSLAANGGSVISTVLPSGSTVTNEYFIDRRLNSKTGSGVVAEFHNYSPAPGLYNPDLCLQDTVHFGAATSSRWVMNGQNELCIPSVTQSPMPGTSAIMEERKHFCLWLSQPDAVTKTGRADADQKMDFDGQVAQTSEDGPDLIGARRAQVTLRENIQVGGHWFAAETNYLFLTENSDQPTVANVTLQRLSGFPVSALSEVTTLDADQQTTVVTTYVDRAGMKVTQVTDVPNSSLNATNLSVNGLLIQQSTASVATSTRYEYDALGRQAKVINSLGGAATKEYNSLGQMSAVTDFAGNRTTYDYCQSGSPGAGQVSCETRPGGKRTYHSYTARGEPFRTWGDVPYPAERVYSSYGELAELHTYRQGSGWGGAAWPTTPGTASVTTWQYDSPSGLLTAKIDNSGNATRYTYENGQVKSRNWQRLAGTVQVAVTNSYNSFGDLTDIEYNDGTPDVHLLDFNRVGQPLTIVDGTGTNGLVYDSAGRLRLMTNSLGVLSGVAVSNHFNAPYGRDLLRVWSGTNQLSTTYGFETTYGRMATVSAGAYWAGYAYVPNSDLLKTATFWSNTTSVLTTTRNWDTALRLNQIRNLAGAVDISSHTYFYDSLNRRRQATLEDGSIWKYEYNDRDELTSAKHYWPDWMPCSGQQFGYLYDNIGNRQKSWNGGDNQGGSLREAVYSANDLNQYANVQTVGYKDITGAALLANAVGVTNTLTSLGGVAERKDEWFRREISVNNTNGPLWQTVGVTSGTVTSNGGFAFPKYDQPLKYDLDGNLSYDGIWTYEWDAENRLRGMSMTNIGNVGYSNRLRLDFAYDFMGRRVSKTVSAWSSGSTFTNKSKEFFVYDVGGWNLIASLSSDLRPQTLYVWGQDLSGSMTKAGGVGGLLGVLVVSNSVVTSGHFPAYDGNGNVTALVNAVGASLSAKYEYSAFGETLRATGSMAKVNPFRFSTKHTDDESGLVYYAYRYYNAALGKWTTRDVAQEVGGRNLFAFALNCPVTFFDGLGDSVQSGQEFQMTVQLGIDLALMAPGVGPPLLNANPAICGLMVFWFGTNGRYDFGSAGNEWFGEEFNVPQMVTLRADQFSNFLAGYAGGYASFKGGTMFYAAAVMGAGELYDSISSYRDVSDGVSMRWNGLLNGIMDALDD
jgi:RHS repeat-associated protein